MSLKNENYIENNKQIRDTGGDLTSVVLLP